MMEFIFDIFVLCGKFPAAWTMASTCRQTWTKWKTLGINAGSMVRQIAGELVNNMQQWCEFVERYKCEIRDAILDPFIINADVTIDLILWIHSRGNTFRMRHALILLNRGKFDEYNYMAGLFNYDRPLLPIIKKPAEHWPQPPVGQKLFWPSLSSEQIYAFILVPLAGVAVNNINYKCDDNYNMWIQLLDLYYVYGPLSIFRVSSQRLEKIAKRVTRNNHAHMAALIFNHLQMLYE